MAGEHRPWTRGGRAHHEAWKRSELKREYCEAQGVPLKAFGNCHPYPPAVLLLPGLRDHSPSPHPIAKGLATSGLLAHVLQVLRSLAVKGKLAHGSLMGPNRKSGPPRFAGTAVGGG
jgi:hypothetical protein